MTEKTSSLQEAVYYPFVLTRDPESNDWIICGPKRDLDRLQRRRMKCYPFFYNGAWALRVRPQTFARKSAEVIRRCQRDHERDLIAYSAIKDIDFPTIDGLTFKVDDDPVIKISGRRIQQFKSLVKFTSSRGLKARDQDDLKWSWYVSPEKFPGLLELIKGADLRLSDLCGRKFHEIEGVSVKLSWDGRYHAFGEKIHLLKWASDGIDCPFTWSSESGGVIKFTSDQADEFDDWILKSEAEVERVRSACIENGWDEIYRGFVDKILPDFQRVKSSVRYDAPWYRVKTPYINDLNGWMRDRSWCWLPQTKEWCKRSAEPNDVTYKDIVSLLGILWEIIPQEPA